MSEVGQITNILRAKTPSQILLLDLRKTYSHSDLKAAYRNLARVIHPDKTTCPGAKEAFIKLHNAYEDLISGVVEAASSTHTTRSAVPSQAKAPNRFSSSENKRTASKHDQHETKQSNATPSTSSNNKFNAEEYRSQQKRKRQSECGVDGVDDDDDLDFVGYSSKLDSNERDQDPSCASTAEDIKSQPWFQYRANKIRRRWNRETQLPSFEELFGPDDSAASESIDTNAQSWRNFKSSNKGSSIASKSGSSGIASIGKVSSSQNGILKSFSGSEPALVKIRMQNMSGHNINSENTEQNKAVHGHVARDVSAEDTDTGRAELWQGRNSTNVDESTAPSQHQKHICHVCKREFKSHSHLELHETSSELHKENVRKATAAVDSNEISI